MRPVEKIGKSVELTFQVVPAQIESQGPMDRPELAAIAGAMGGQLFCQCHSKSAESNDGDSLSVELSHDQP